MATFLLVMIYIAFISLGLPDAILGSAWPIIHKTLNVPVSFAGIMTMIICGGTIVSSLFSNRVIRRFGTGKVTVISVMMTAVALIGISITPTFFGMCLLGIPLGLGAGAVDSALNNFVALHYKAKHMNWLHCFWGIGATAGPFLMSMFLLKENGWRSGYTIISILQVILVICLTITLPIWRKYDNNEDIIDEQKSDVKISTLLKLKGAKPALISFFCYCALEATVGLWGSSYLVISKDVSPGVAAKWISLYYLGITVGRGLAGFLAMKLNNKQMMRIGQIICFVGTIILMIPISVYLQMSGLILIGLGCAPIYPAMLHETPNRFGTKMSQGIMGIQMATAYVGSTFIPPLFGIIGNATKFNLFPMFLTAITLLMFITTEDVNKRLNKANLS